MQDQQTLTHKALAELLGVSETTVKSYRRKFPDCIPVASQGKPIRFTEQASKVALKIRDLFNLGMSVAEVRLRLAEEFPWIEASAKEERPKAEVDSKRTDITPELTANVSSLAKSMVTMSHQQKAILSRMQGIEGMLEELGLYGDSESFNQKRKETVAIAREKEALLEARLGSLDGTTQSLVEKVSLLAEDLERFLGKRQKVAEEWRASGGLKSAEVQESLAKVQENTNTSKVIPLRREAETRAPHLSIDMAESEKSAEPPRRFLTLPLMVRTAQGQYISADGRGRSRFCINDLKAMLAYGFMPPHHFSFSWEAHGQGWWLTLAQETPQAGKEPRLHKLLLMELPTQGGDTVVEVLQINNNGEEAAHPAEICAIINSLNA